MNGYVVQAPRGSHWTGRQLAKDALCPSKLETHDQVEPSESTPVIVPEESVCSLGGCMEMHEHTVTEATPW